MPPRLRLICCVLMGLVPFGFAGSRAADIESGANLDAFLHGIETRCRGADAFEEFAMLVAERHVPRFGSPRLYDRKVLPKTVKAAVGRETVTDQGARIHIATPVSGTFRGLRVNGIEFAIGKSGDAFAFAIVFSSPMPEVRRVFEGAVRDLNTRLRGGPDGEAASLIDLSGQPKLVCNLVPDE